jgi:glycerol-3-phosphate acyltransferase PlsX
MGGDKAPQIVVEGASLFAAKNKDAEFLLFGNEKKIKPIIAHCRHLKNRFKIIHTEEFISADEKPSNALRRGTNSSMRLAIDSVKLGQADVMVSAGNTGALMAIAKVILRPMPSIDRPAIVTTMPNKKGKSTVFLDMGANIDCDAHILFQFAVMGCAFARAAMNIENPKIGVLNVGSEELKGHDDVRNVATMLKNSNFASNYHGYVEGDDIAKGEVDVIVTDGFTGNITLKAIEGTAKMISGIIKQGFMASILAKIGYVLASSSLKKSAKLVDPRYHNGAMLVGLNGIVVKSHGGTDAIGFANSIKVANSLVEQKINEKIIKDIEMAEESMKLAQNNENQDENQK